MSINATLIGQMITFALLVWFTMKYVWPPIMQALEERKKRIAEGLAAAERGQHEMDLAEKRASGLLREAKDQAADVVGFTGGDALASRSNRPGATAGLGEGIGSLACEEGE